jgi:hypothetical protein
MQKIQFFRVNGVLSVHLLYKTGRFSSIQPNQSIISIPTAPKSGKATPRFLFPAVLHHSDPVTFGIQNESELQNNKDDQRL